ncbi:MAG: hypothetical protein ACOCW2_00450 [Chitinivibrionales bacterium]
MKRLPYHLIEKSPASATYPYAGDQTSIYMGDSSGESEKALAAIGEETNTVALLIVHNDTLIYEKYLDSYAKDSLIASFPLTKSFFSI